MWIELLISSIKIGLVINVLLVSVAYAVYAERRVSAFMQNRYGPNRVGYQGLLQSFADVIKLVFKEDIVPAKANKPIHTLAPMISIFVALTTIAVVPFGHTIELFGRVIPLPLVAELFSCGAEVYAKFQPQFLAEYLLEYLDPESEPAGALCRIEACHEVAVSMLWREIGRFQKEGFAAASSEEYAHRLNLLDDFQRCRSRLAKVREDLGIQGD